MLEESSTRLNPSDMDEYRTLISTLLESRGGIRHSRVLKSMELNNIHSLNALKQQQTSDLQAYVKLCALIGQVVPCSGATSPEEIALVCQAFEGLRCLKAQDPSLSLKTVDFIRSVLSTAHRGHAKFTEFATLSLKRRATEMLGKEFTGDFISNVTWNARYSDITKDYVEVNLLFFEVVVAKYETDGKADVPLTHLIKMFVSTSHLHTWLMQMPGTALVFNRIASGFLKLANSTKTVLKLGFFIKALEFGLESVKFGKEVFKLQMMFDAMSLKNSAQVYQYTCLPFWDLCEKIHQDKELAFSPEMVALIQKYDAIKNNKLSWKKFLGKEEDPAIMGALKGLQIEAEVSVQSVQELISQKDDLINDKTTSACVIRGLMQLPKNPDWFTLVNDALSVLSTTKELSKTNYTLLDNITLILRTSQDEIQHEAAFLAVLTNMVELLRTQGQMKRMRNFSNLAFQKGVRLLQLDAGRAVEHWKLSIRAELIATETDPSNYDMFKAKAERIAHSLIEARQPEEAMKFLLLLLETRASQVNDVQFFELLTQFRQTMDTFVKLVCKAITISASSWTVLFESTLVSDSLMSVVAMEVIGTLSGFPLRQRSSLFLKISALLTQTITDKGLLLICLLRIQDVIPTESPLFEELCEDFETTAVKQFQAIVFAKAYLKLCVVSSSFHNTKVLQSIESFYDAVSQPPTHSTLFYEFEVLEELYGYLMHTGLQAYASCLLSTYMDNRKSCLTETQLVRFYMKLAEVKLYLKFPLQVSNALSSANLILKGMSTDNLDVVVVADWRLQQLEYAIEVGNLAFAEEKCQKLIDWFSCTEQLQYDKARTKHRSVELLFRYARLQVLVARLSFENNNYIKAVACLKKSIKILQNILQKFIPSFLAVNLCEADLLRWKASSDLVLSFKLLLDVLIHINAAKECDFYSNELMAILSLQDIALTKCDLTYFIARYKLVSGKIKDSSALIAAADEDFNYNVFTNKFVELDRLATHALFFQLTQNTEEAEKHYCSIDKVFEFLRSGAPEELALHDRYSDEFIHSPEEQALLERMRLSIDFQKSVSALNGTLVSRDISHTCKPNFKYDFLRVNVLKGRQSLALAKDYLAINPEFSGLEESAVVLPAVESAVNGSKTLEPVLEKLSRSKNLLEEAIQSSSVFKGYEFEETFKTYLSSFGYSGALTSNKVAIADLMHLADAQKYAFFQNDKRLHMLADTETSLLPSLEGINETPTTVSKDLLGLIPQTWKVISVDICSITGDLLVSSLDPRLETSQFFARLPLNRHAARDVSEKSLSFLDGLKELQMIIHESDQTTDIATTSQVKTKEDRAEWWKQRGELDMRLQRLLHDAEYYWLGGFRGIFSPAKFDPSDVQVFKQKFLAILNTHLPSRNTTKLLGRKSHAQVALNDTVYELFLKLGKPSKLGRIEYLEDLMYFVLDVLLFHGEENAYDEIDLDQLYIDIETLLELTLSGMDHSMDSTQHTVLVLSSACQFFPWESFPSLRGHSVSRVPSFQMLLQMLQDRKLDPVDCSSGYFVLNPGGDLTRTEGTFRSMFESLDGWTGKTGEPPTEPEFIHGLTSSGLFAYMGHGGGEQYVKSKTIKKQSDCAPALLLGCSSGSLRANGVLESYGTVYNYLVGGSPMVLAAMWDVTDKDMDRFTQSVLADWGLFPGSDHTSNIAEAIPEAREKCTLKYLNGAAPVLYGLPLSIKHSK